MSLGAEAWWAAMMGADQFEDGSLVIEDDTLDVDGGNTVNLRVKLGARPRSDVTVALSETSTLISLGDDELTFTPANWDDFQDVVVTAGGNRQEISLPDANTGSGGWVFNTSRPAIIAGLRGTAIRRLFQFTLPSDTQVHLNIEATLAGTPQNNQDLSDTFETSGSITAMLGGTELSFNTEGYDTADIYSWNSAGVASLDQTDIAAFRQAYVDASDRTATLTLRDYVPGDATISLSASGTPEYDGKTGSATVSVD